MEQPEHKAIIGNVLTGMSAAPDGGGPGAAPPGETPAKTVRWAAEWSAMALGQIRRGWAAWARISAELEDGIPRSAHVTIGLCGAMVVAFALWATLSTLDVVSMVTGEVIPSSQVKSIQHLEGGIVREIFVKEGEAVKQDQPLVALEPTVSGADVGELKVRLTSLGADLARLDALSRGRAQPSFAPEFVRDHPELARQSRMRFESQKTRHESEVKRQEEIIAQRMHEIREITSRIASSKQGLKLVREQIAISESLLVDQIASRFQHLDLLKEAQKLQGAIESDSAGLEKTQSALKEAQAEFSKIKSAFSEEIQKSHDEARLSFDELSQRLRKFEDSLKRPIVRSPVDGVVKTLKVATVGGVLRPGELLADIVPADDHLVIEAKLPTSDIGYVVVGQTAIVKLATSDAIRYGNLKGSVIVVSPDALVTSDGRPFYKVRIATERDHFQQGQYKYTLVPGMQVVASVQIGTRTVLEYLIDPVRYSMGQAAQER